MNNNSTIDVGKIFICEKVVDDPYDGGYFYFFGWVYISVGCYDNTKIYYEE